MKTEVSKAIKELLFEHPAVIVPGLGGFVAGASPATVDYVQGVVMPPAKKLEFNPNLVINDGLLVGHLQKTEVVTAQQAKESVDLFVEEINAALERREIVELPEVGRLYKDYEHKIRFMPEGTNFEANSFGLPKVQFTPVLRERPATANGGTSTVPPRLKPVASPVGPSTTAASAAATTGATATPVRTSATGWVNKIWPVLVVLAAVLVALSIFLFLRGDGEPAIASDELKQERINVKPGTAVDGTPEAPPSGRAGNSTAETPPTTAPSLSEDNPAPAAQPAPKQETTPPPPVAGSQTGSFIVIHSLGNPSNLAKFEKQMTRDGYTPHKVKMGELYRIGILFEHRDDAELDTKLKELAKKYDASPKVVDYQ